MIELDKYSDKEIVEALLILPMQKMLVIIQSIGKANERAEKRAETIAKEMTDSIIEKILRGSDD